MLDQETKRKIDTCRDILVGKVPDPIITGVTVPKLNQQKLCSIKIPLPSLEVQKEIVSEIESYEKVIDESKKHIEVFERKIQTAIDNVWRLK